jgi:hypothetical protein
VLAKIMRESATDLVPSLSLGGVLGARSGVSGSAQQTDADFTSTGRGRGGADTGGDWPEAAGGWEAGAMRRLEVGATAAGLPQGGFAMVGRGGSNAAILQETDMIRSPAAIAARRAQAEQSKAATAAARRAAAEAQGRTSIGGGGGGEEGAAWAGGDASGEPDERSAEAAAGDSEDPITAALQGLSDMNASRTEFPEDALLERERQDPAGDAASDTESVQNMIFSAVFSS